LTCQGVGVVGVEVLGVGVVGVEVVGVEVVVEPEGEAAPEGPLPPPPASLDPPALKYFLLENTVSTVRTRELQNKPKRVHVASDGSLSTNIVASRKRSNLLTTYPDTKAEID